MNNQKAFPEQHLTIGALLRIPYQHLNRLVYEQFALLGHPDIRPSHSVVFRHVLPAGSRITELAELAGMTKQSMAALVDFLLRTGYVTLAADPRDGRAKLVVLTARGEEVQRLAMQLSADIERQWAGIIGAGQMAAVRAGLEQLFRHLQNGDSGAAGE